VAATPLLVSVLTDIACDEKTTTRLRRRQPSPQGSASRTGAATAKDGSVAVSGTVIGDINLFTGAPVQTRYREQVLRISPGELLGRSAELAELARFCTASEPTDSYLLWRGKAWAGKTALTSWFVLNPPQGVRIVSFFITARFPGQADRNAFIENVLEQLATLLGEPLPTYLTQSTKEAHLLGMLSDAARACRERNERLVLVVDGLDEDRGESGAPDTYSIAALLPDAPPAGLRIVVTGRENPPLPPDVPPRHRLRDPAIVRTLSASPYAVDVRKEMESELKRLLRGREDQQDLLGLLTASGGGLAGSDLGELTGRLAWQIKDELGAVTGRSFSTRPSYWRPGGHPDMYVLGHEELQRIAEEYLGNARLEVYRAQLHAWADRYQKSGWPVSTPEYLLRGYYRMLMSTENIGRMLACANNRGRHERMLAISGGDTAAIEEITAAMDVIVGSGEPDLAAIARLAVLRDYLADRNTMIPAELPAAWAGLGQVLRAEALAKAIIDPGRRALALVKLVKALTVSGDFRHAELIAASITHPGRRGEAMMTLLRAVAMSGDIDSAQAHLHSVTSEGEQTFGLIILAQAAASTGDLDQARIFIERAEAGLPSLTRPGRHAEALAAMGQVLAVAGDLPRARTLIREAETLAQSIEQVSGQVAAWVALIRAAGAADSPDQSLRMINKAESAVRSVTSKASRARALASLARATNTAGHKEQARSLAAEAIILVRSVEKPGAQAELWAGMLRATAAAGLERAPGLAREAVAVAESVPDLAARASALATLSRATAALGEGELARRLASEAEVLTRSVVDPERRARDLAALAKVAAAEGIVGRAEDIARSIIGSRSHYRVEALTNVARAVAARGDLSHARTIIESIASPEHQVGALAAIAKDAALAGKLTEAEEIGRSVTSPIPRAEVLIALAAGLAAAGDYGRAQQVVQSLTSPRQRSSAFAALAEASMAAGARDRAVAFAQQAESAAAAATRYDQAASLAAVARALAVTGRLDRAEEVARSIPVPGQRGMARAAIAKTAAAAGNVPWAEIAAEEIEDGYWRAMAETAIVEALAASGDIAGAQNLITRIRAEVSNIPHLNQQESVLVRLSKVAGAAIGVDKADEIVSAIASPARRAEALAALSEIADPAHVPTLIARAAQLTHWTTSLQELVRVQPDVLEAVFAEVEGIINASA
jgi:tetratricopeptide (TPR) repeat protein